MTNEQKARELAKTLIDDDRNIEPLVDLLLQAIQWKDEQHAKEKQKLIDEACEWWISEFTYPTMTQDEIKWYQTKIVEFKNAMKGE